jgi:DNA-directed RNA polymerase II subunit RPB2
MYPMEARLRNLTYSAPLFVDIRKVTRVADPNHPLNQGITNINDMHLEQEGDEEVLERVFIGKVPIMVRSSYCILSSMSSQEVVDFKECPYDQV